MIHFCVCGAHGGQFSPTKRIYVTLMGACEVIRPTVARQIVAAKQRGDAIDKRRGYFFLTICGAAGIKAPTLAQEYVDFQDALRAGMLTVEEWDRAVGRLAADESTSIGSFTVCGVFDAGALPEEAEELEALAVQRHVGQIPERASNLLLTAVGQQGGQRPAVVRQAVASALT